MSTIPTRIVPVSPFKPLATYAGIRAVYTTADGERLVGVTEVGEGTVTGGHLIVRFEDGKYGMTGDVTLEVVLEPSACVNPEHDHTTGVDLDGSSLDTPIPMLCTDCGVPTHYDETIRDYVHDDPTSGACPLAYAADETDPAVSPCTFEATPEEPTAIESAAARFAEATVAAGPASLLEKLEARAARATGTTPVIDRDEAIQRIRTALRTRSGKTWSVKGGRGTSRSWITVSAPPARLTATGSMTPEDAKELGDLLGLDAPAHHQGVSIAASNAYRREYVDRAEGRTPSVIAQPYWD